MTFTEVNTQTTPVSVHFAHANGFPSGSYRKLFSYLPEHYQINSIDKFGHSARFPIGKNWRNQINELIHFIEDNEKAPVYAVGHSFGGVVSYMTACERPDLFKGLIMLDPPVVTGASRYFFKFAKRTQLINKLTPAKLAETRCQRWHKDTDVVAYFQQKKLFAQMDVDCIRDYVHSATTQNGEHVQLTFDANVEAAIFRHIPDNLDNYFGQLKCPATLITAEHTNVCFPSRINPFIKGNNLKHQIFKGGTHMFPLEQPQQLASIIEAQISEWQAIG